MTKLTRYLQKVFSANSALGTIKKFGSLAAGTPANATTPLEVQELANYEGGWPAAILGNNSPAIEDMNAVHYAMAYQIAYLMQKGVPEWHLEETYYIGDIVNVGGKLYISLTESNINNAIIDLANWKLIVSTPDKLNTIMSGATRSTSNQPQFITPNGAAASLIINGATKSLNLMIGGKPVEISTDLAVTGLTVGPSATETCLVNDADAADQNSTRLWGEYKAEKETIIVDAMGAQFQSFIGQFVICEIVGVTTEYMFAFVKSVTELTNIYRGWFTDSAGAPINRTAFFDNDVITVLSTAWVFVDDDGTSFDITYKTPIRSATEPSAPTSGLYWLNLITDQWSKGDGSNFNVVARHLIGIAGIDSANCIVARSFDFFANHSDQNNIELEINSTTIVRIKNQNSRISVFGEEFHFGFNKESWDITTDLADSSDMYNATEQATTEYFLYVKDTGGVAESDISPHYRPDLLGHFHPHNPWRCVGQLFNDSGNNIILVDEVRFNLNIKSKIIIFKHIESVGVTGGSSSISFATRTINTKEGDAEFGLVSSNQVRLISGRYIVKTQLQSHRANGAATKLKNITDTSDDIIGIPAYSPNATNVASTISHVDGELNKSDTKVYEYQQSSVDVAANGHGRAANKSVDEVYLVSIIEKVG